jgi:hypothetical protein
MLELLEGADDVPGFVVRGRVRVQNELGADDRHGVLLFDL